MTEEEFEENRGGWDLMLIANPLARALPEPYLRFQEDDPIWFRNFMYFVVEPDHHARLYLILWFQPLINKWLDTVNVKGHPRREAIVQWTEAAYSSMLDFSNLRTSEDPWGSVQTWKRLKGLSP